MESLFLCDASAAIFPHLGADQLNTDRKLFVRCAVNGSRLFKALKCQGGGFESANVRVCSADCLDRNVVLHSALKVEAFPVPRAACAAVH